MLITLHASADRLKVPLALHIKEQELQTLLVYMLQLYTHSLPGLLPWSRSPYPPLPALLVASLCVVGVVIVSPVIFMFFLIIRGCGTEAKQSV